MALIFALRTREQVRKNVVRRIVKLLLVHFRSLEPSAPRGTSSEYKAEPGAHSAGEHSGQPNLNGTHAATPQPRTAAAAVKQV